MEEKKRKVVTYHSTISNDKLERALNEGEGYKLENIIPHGAYETLILVEDKEIRSFDEITINENIADFAKVDLKDEDYDKQKDELFKKGYKLCHLTSQRALFVKKRDS